MLNIREAKTRDVTILQLQHSRFLGVGARSIPPVQVPGIDLPLLEKPVYLSPTHYQPLSDPKTLFLHKSTPFCAFHLGFGVGLQCGRLSLASARDVVAQPMVDGCLGWEAAIRIEAASLTAG